MKQHMAASKRILDGQRDELRATQRGRESEQHECAIAQAEEPIPAEVHAHERAQLLDRERVFLRLRNAQRATDAPQDGPHDRMRRRRRECPEIGDHAALANGERGWEIGSNRWPNPEPSAPL
jgi:hypothetical protein